MRLGVIGFGRLGELLCQKLAQDFDLSVYEKRECKKQIESIGAKSVSLKEVCRNPYLLILVPISHFEDLIKEIAPEIRPGTLVMDACSIKTHPVEVMKKYLHPEVQILATHPMFGPDSARETFFGNKIVLNKVRVNEKLSQEIKSYLERAGLKVIETTAEIHDKEIASSLVLTHFIGRTLIDFGAKDLEIDTKGYRRLMKILCTVENDSWQLFEDMNKYNPFAQEVIGHFYESFGKIKKRVLE